MNIYVLMKPVYASARCFADMRWGSAWITHRHRPSMFLPIFVKSDTLQKNVITILGQTAVFNSRWFDEKRWAVKLLVLEYFFLKRSDHRHMQMKVLSNNAMLINIRGSSFQKKIFYILIVKMAKIEIRIIYMWHYDKKMVIFLAKSCCF